MGKSAVDSKYEALKTLEDSQNPGVAATGRAARESSTKEFYKQARDTHEKIVELAHSLGDTDYDHRDAPTMTGRQTAGDPTVAKVKK